MWREKVEEVAARNGDGEVSYQLQASKTPVLPDMVPFQPYIDKMSAADPVVLELAVTYDMFRESGSDHAEALERLRRKKGNKCGDGREHQAFDLLRTLGLPAA